MNRRTGGARALDVEALAHPLPLDDVPVALLVVDALVRATEVNRAWAALTGLDRDASAGEGWMGAIHPEHRARVRDALERARTTDGPVRDEWDILRVGAGVRTTSVRVQAATDGGRFVVALLDITDWRAREAELIRRASHDPLTGLFNRAALADRAEHALARFARSGHPPALLFIDLDGFKGINDRYGHGWGDHVLATVAARLQSVTRPSDTLARVGGDEFALLCEDLRHTADAHRVAGRLREAAASPPLDVEGQRVVVTLSIGIAFAEHRTDTLEVLLHRADESLYEAKRRQDSVP